MVEASLQEETDRFSHCGGSDQCQSDHSINGTGGFFQTCQVARVFRESRLLLSSARYRVQS
jgi:hypothetical protein